MSDPNQDPTTTPGNEAAPSLEERTVTAYEQIAQFAEPYLESYRRQGIPEEQLIDGGASLQFRVGAKDQVRISIGKELDTYVITRQSYWSQISYGKQYHLESSVEYVRLSPPDRARRAVQALNEIGASRMEDELKVATTSLDDLSDEKRFRFEGLLVKRRVSN